MTDSFQEANSCLGTAALSAAAALLRGVICNGGFSRLSSRSCLTGHANQADVCSFSSNGTIAAFIMLQGMVRRWLWYMSKEQRGPYGLPLQLPHGCFSGPCCSFWWQHGMECLYQRLCPHKDGLWQASYWS